MNIILEYMLLLSIAIYSYLESFVKLFLPVSRKSVAGDIVLITGSGHGIGHRTALEFAKHHSILVLWDINQKGVEETADECRKLGATAHAFVVDCSNCNDIYRCAEKVKQDIGDVDILINNAGVVFGTEFLELQDHHIEKTFSVNILAHFWTAKSFLPAMMKKNRGHIVTVASIAGHLGIPYLVDYWVWPVLKTEDVVKRLMEGILTNKKMIIVPSSVKYSLVLNNFLPERFITALTMMQDVQFSTPYRCDKKD